VAGKVISGFGPRADGTHNDGVNVAAPMGTDVHAAESGVVAYAGDELKGYGNLVLLRHDNGWVTAYAHADEIMVKRGDRIKRGQVIARAGRTGQVDQPQVHFELRQGQKPVDPTPFMERM
jgi:murein DD-endopeptidase MepM/ murein hydrolase activator NlpD